MNLIRLLFRTTQGRQTNCSAGTNQCRCDRCKANCRALRIAQQEITGRSLFFKIFETPTKHHHFINIHITDHP
ncbi:hypothetical protein DO71_5401 [Burkholderia pseudomallei]|nr:hypothetical protein DO71_5401 [Burkholderia pseudomallei]